MAFPLTLRDTRVEIYVNGDWVDISSSVREDARIAITRGAPGEAAQTQPTTCSLTLNDPNGDFALRNPNGAYYGYLKRNIPIRISVGLAADTFTRTSANDWGTLETGEDWGHHWGHGSINDFDVGSGVATQAVTATNSFKLTYIANAGYRDDDVAVTVTMPYADVTGGSISTGFVLRGLDTLNYYNTEFRVNASEQMSISMWSYTAGAFTSLASSVSVTDFTYTGQPIRMRAQIVGDTILFKVWPAADPEPFDWHAEATVTTLPEPGWVGMRSDIYTANTNALPGVFTFDNFEVRSPRFMGEVSKWPHRWDTSGNLITVSIEAASVLRRISQGDPPLDSTLYRGLTSLAIPPVAYWPGEDGSDATYLSSAVTGPPMTVVGEVDFAAYDDIPSSRALLQVSDGSLDGPVLTYTSTGAVQLRYLMHAPTDFAAHTWISGLQCTGGQSWDVKYQPGGGLSFDLWVNAILIFTTGAIGFDVLDTNVMVSIELEQNGANIDWALKTIAVGESVGDIFDGTTAGRTLGRPVRVLLNPSAGLTGTAFGHINVRKEVTSLFDLAQELKAFAGETALTRISLLAEQNDLDVHLLNADITSALVGPQRPLGALSLIQEAADADLGLFGDARNTPSLLYRERARMYSQTPTVTLDYTGGQLGEPFDPVDDDRFTRNDITANRLNGGFARAVQETGPMSVLDPSAGGVGRITTQITVNVASNDQLPDVAGWLLNLGTVDETRYPAVTVNLHNPAVYTDLDLSRAMLDLDMGDRFDIINPKQGQTPDTIRLVVLGYEEIIGPFTHTITIFAAPAAPYDVSELDHADSRLDTSGSDLTNTVTTTATSFQVDTPTGALWTTRAADLPLPIMFGGEEVLVGAVSGTSSPQTFSSVTRSVNGIVKAHAAGTAVSLPPRYQRRLGL